MGLLKAEAQLADLISGARQQEMDEAAANVNLVKVAYEKAVEDLARREALFQAGVIAQEELDRFKNNLELEKNRLQAAEARLSLLESGNRSQTIVAAQAEVKRSQAVLKAAEVLLEDLKIYSPINGVVLTKNYQPGEFVQMGISLATVANLNDLWIKVYISTDDLPAILLGQEVHFTVSGDPTIFDGVVEEIASKGEFTPKTIQTKQERSNVVFGVKIRTDSHNGVLKPGMPADVTFFEYID
jgi:HlyD family secretion protein